MKQCCDVIFLSARGVIQSNNAIVLGKYHLTDRVHANRPVYAQMIYGKEYMFFYREQGI